MRDKFYVIDLRFVIPASEPEFRDLSICLIDEGRLIFLIHSLDAPGLRFTPDGNLFDGQEIHVGSYSISVIHTPGHSPGGVCLHAPGAVFTGDTLFAGSVGRTDFPGGDHNRLISGVINKIFPLGDDLRIYPGHGPVTTIGRERMTNPFFRISSRA